MVNENKQYHYHITWVLIDHRYVLVEKETSALVTIAAMYFFAAFILLNYTFFFSLIFII